MFPGRSIHQQTIQVCQSLDNSHNLQSDCDLARTQDKKLKHTKTTVNFENMQGFGNGHPV